MKMIRRSRYILSLSTLKLLPKAKSRAMKNDRMTLKPKTETKLETIREIE